MHDSINEKTVVTSSEKDKYIRVSSTFKNGYEFQDI